MSLMSLWFPALLVGAVSFLAMSPALKLDFLMLWDDPLYVVNNPLIHSWSLSNLAGIFTRFFVGNYAPVQILSYTLDYSIWNLDPFGYHLTNVVLHACNASLVFLLTRRLGYGVPTALVGALIFALHPTQVESVAWVSQRKNVLAMTFTLLSVLCHIRSGEERRVGFRGLSLAFYGMALLTKSVAIGLPLVLMAADIHLKRRRSAPDRVAWVISYFLFAIAAAILSVRSQHSTGAVHYYGGSPWATALTMCGVALDYARIVIFPTNLAGIYKPEIVTVVDVRVLAGLGLVFGFLWFVVWCYRTGRTGLFFWCVWILVTVLPVSQIVPINALMADRYLYFPMVGMGVLIGMALNSYSAGLPERGIAVLILTACIALTVHRIPLWKNDFVFWQDVVRKTPSDAQSHVHYGIELEKRRQDVAALREYETAVEFDSTYYWAYNQLAVLYLRSNDSRLRNVRKAMDNADRAMILSGGGMPEIVDTWIAALKASGKHDQAQAAREKAMREWPGNSLFLHEPKREETRS